MPFDATGFRERAQKLLRSNLAPADRHCPAADARGPVALFEREERVATRCATPTDTASPEGQSR
jgi:hypothetical protein